jgi:major membrane immunogen (membrane-anchored lipoprotein)
MTNSDKRNNRKTVILFVAVSMVLCSLLIGAMKMKKDNEFLLSQVELKEQVFTAYKNEKGETIATQDQRILEMTKENMKLIQTVNDFKKIKGQVKIETVTEIKEVKVPYEVVVTTYLDKDSNLFVKVPLPFSKKDSFYSIDGKVEHDGVSFGKISIPNTLTITTGQVNGGFLKKDKYIVEIKSDNPYTDITKLKNTEFKPKTKFYKKWWFGFSLGAIATIFLLK